MEKFSKLLTSRRVKNRRGRIKIHRHEGIAERFNRTIAERIFGHQYAQELMLNVRGSSERSRGWVKS